MNICFLFTLTLLNAECDIENTGMLCETIIKSGFYKDVKLAMISCLGSDEDCSNAMMKAMATPKFIEMHVATIVIRMRLLYLAAMKILFVKNHRKAQEDLENANLGKFTRKIFLQKLSLKYRLQWICEIISCSLFRHTSFKKFRKFRKEIQLLKKQRFEHVKMLVKSKLESKDEIRLFEAEFNANLGEQANVEEYFIDGAAAKFKVQKAFLKGFIVYLYNCEIQKTKRFKLRQ